MRFLTKAAMLYIWRRFARTSATQTWTFASQMLVAITIWFTIAFVIMRIAFRYENYENSWLLRLCYSWNHRGEPTFFQNCPCHVVCPHGCPCNLPKWPCENNCEDLYEGAAIQVNSNKSKYITYWKLKCTRLCNTDACECFDNCPIFDYVCSENCGLGEASNLWKT